MNIKTKFFSGFKPFNSPLKVAVLMTPLALGVSLGLEWVFTRAVTRTTVWITIPVTFILTYLLTGVMLRYQGLLDEKNDQLQRMTRDLQRANETMSAQNEDLEAFAQTVAHELKTPLSIMLGNSYLLGKKEYQESPIKIEEVARQITETSLKMDNIIQEMLQLTSQRPSEKAQIQPLDMNEIVTETLQQLDHLITERQAKIKTPTVWPTVQGYGPWIEKVWINYISNALKYGGNAPEIELGAEQEANGHIRFWVRDSGPGMTPEEQAQAFSQFTRFNATKAVGHGLGLSITKQIIEKLGGEVGVESRPKDGSTFYFTLPCEN